MDTARPGFLSGIPNRVKLLIFVLSVNSLASGYLMVFVTAYLPEVGISSKLVGTIIGAEGITMVIVGIPLGVLSDRIGRKWILNLSSAGLAPVIFIFALTREPTLLILAGIIVGVAEGGFLSTLNATIADQTPVSRRDTAFAFSFVLTAVFSGIGFSLPFTFSYLASFLGITLAQVHEDVLVIFAFVVIATPFSLFAILRNYEEKIVQEKGGSLGASMRNLVKFSGANSLIGLGAGFIIPLIATWLYLKFGVPDKYSGPLLAVSNITIGLSALLSPRMSRRFGIVNAIVINQGLSTVFMISLAFVGSPALAASLYIVRAALMNMSSPLADSFLMGLVPRERRGLASAINSVVWRLPNSVTTIAGGIILASGNYALPFELATAFYVVAISMFYIFFRGYNLQSLTK
ncbi:MAG: MFS transporter [Nitrososphaerota archaeon]|nr:MFS transporter [Nitrososphaerota archaeon]